MVPKNNQPKKQAKKTAPRNDEDFVYTGIRNIRRPTWDRLRAYAKQIGSNSGTVISDAVDQWIKDHPAAKKAPGRPKKAEAEAEA